MLKKSLLQNDAPIAIPNDQHDACSLGVLGNWNFENFPSNLWAQIIAIAVIVVSMVLYLVMKNSQKSKGISVDYAFKRDPARVI